MLNQADTTPRLRTLSSNTLLTGRSDGISPCLQSPPAQTRAMSQNCELDPARNASPCRKCANDIAQKLLRATKLRRDASMPAQPIANLRTGVQRPNCVRAGRL